MNRITIWIKQVYSVVEDGDGWVTVDMKIFDEGGYHRMQSRFPKEEWERISAEGKYLG